MPKSLNAHLQHSTLTISNPSEINVDKAPYTTEFGYAEKDEDNATNHKKDEIPTFSLSQSMK